MWYKEVCRALFLFDDRVRQEVQFCINRGLIKVAKYEDCVNASPFQPGYVPVLRSKRPIPSRGLCLECSVLDDCSNSSDSRTKCSEYKPEYESVAA